MQSEAGYSAYSLLMNCVDPPAGWNNHQSICTYKDHILFKFRMLGLKRATCKFKNYFINDEYCAESAVCSAELYLQQIQALSLSRTGLLALTPLGRHLAALPCSPQVIAGIT